MEKSEMDAWLEIAEKIATETAFNSEQADALVSQLAVHGASPETYGKRLIERVGSTEFFTAAKVQADMLFMEFLYDQGINPKQFTRGEVIKILKYYAEIDGHIAWVRRGLKDYEDTYFGLHSSGFGGASSKTNRISNPTEAAVLNIPDSVRKKVDGWRAEIERLCELQAAIFSEICKLEVVEKNIIDDFYIKKRQWVQISSHVHYSETQCKKIRNKALDKLGGFFERNPVIKNFNYPI